MWWRRRRDEDFQREIDAHIALEADRLIAEGMAPDDARASARRTFGNITHAQERHFEARRWIWLDHFGRDLRYAFRLIRRQPAPAVAVVLTVALAMAANGALFAIFDGLLFRPLPYPDADRIVAILIPPNSTQTPARRQLIGDLFNATNLLSDQARATETRILFNEKTEEASRDGLRAAEITPSLFTLLGVKPVVGRLLADDDLGVLSPQPVLIGYDLWRTRFDANPAIVDQVVNFPGRIGAVQPLLIVGVLPRGFDFPNGSNVWHVYEHQFPQQTQFARLGPGATIAQVRAAFPQLTFIPLREFVRPRGASAFGFLLVATILLMVVAWVQVAALLSARSAGRAAELGVRLALGATRWRLTCQFAAEGLLIALVALALAWIAAPALTTLIVRLLPAEMTLGQVVQLDRRVFAFTAALSFAGVLVVTLAPLEVLRQSSPLGLMRGSLLGQVQLSATRARRSLLIGQLAATTVLLYMAGLATHSFARVSAADLGFDPKHLVAFRTPPSVAALATQNCRFFEVRETLRTLPGVISSGSGRLPLTSFVVGGNGHLLLVTSSDPLQQTLEVGWNQTTPGYIEALHLRVREGHVPADGEAGVVVNATFARWLAQFGPVIGQVIRNNYAGGIGANPVVGIVDDLVVTRPDVPVEPEVFVYRRTFIPANVAFIARVDGSEESTVPAIRAMLQRSFPDSTQSQIFRLEDDAMRATADYRARSTLLALIGLLCVPLAMAGIAGALLQATRQQAREIGIRLALGAEPGHIRRRMVGDALVCVGIGLGLGIVGGLGVGRWMSTYLFGVGAGDPWTIVCVAVVLVIVAWGSALWPAYRASTIDPSVVLRDS